MEDSFHERLDIQRVSGCAHFHYETVELAPIEVSLVLPSPDRLGRAFRTADSDFPFTLRVLSNGHVWLIYRCFKEIIEFDRQLHRCIYDRRFSRLEEFPCPEKGQDIFDDDMLDFMRTYFRRFSDIAGSLITCYPVLKWLELDSRGNRLLPAEETPINTPAVAAAYVTRDYAAQAADELSLKVGDIISVIDMPPATESAWWKGKLTIVSSCRQNRVRTQSDSDDFAPGPSFGVSLNQVDKSPPMAASSFPAQFEVGFFPSECVQIFGNQMKRVPELLEKSYTGRSQSIDSTLKGGQAAKPVFQRRGKLMTFLRGFLSNRPSRRHLKESGILRERVFGCDLGEHLQNTGQHVPVILRSCAEAIESHGVVDGVYRLSGVVSNIQRLRNGFDENKNMNLEEKAILQDIHCVGSLLKMYFRELPNPLFTYQLYGKFAEAVECVQDKNQRILRLHDIVQQLPPPHYRTAEFLMRHLGRVGDAGRKTGMHHQNLAIVWAPNLFRCRDMEVSRDSNGAMLRSVNVQAVILEYLIKYVDIIFNHKMPAWRSQSAQVSAISGNPCRRRQRPQSMSSPLSSPSPSKLMDLGEAQRKLLASRQEKIPPGTGLPDLSNRKCIDVVGGPAPIDGKYHTVIDIPVRGAKRSSGWRSIFGGRNAARKPRISGPMPLGAPGSAEGSVIEATPGGDTGKQRDTGAMYGSLQHVNMKGWDARVRLSRRQQQREEQEKQNRSLEEERAFRSQPELRPSRSVESLLNEEAKPAEKKEPFPNDVIYGQDREPGSSTESTRDTSTSRGTTPMGTSTTSDSSAAPLSSTTPPTVTGNNPEWTPKYNTFLEVTNTRQQHKPCVETDIDSGLWPENGFLARSQVHEIAMTPEFTENCKKAPFSGGLEMNSPDLAENRRLDLDRSANSSIEALLTTDDDGGDVINSTADWFLVSSEGTGANRKPPPEENQPIVVVVNDNKENEGEFEFDDAQVAVGLVSPGLSPNFLAPKTEDNYSPLSSDGSSVYSLRIFEEEERKLLEELRKLDYAPDATEDGREMFPGRNSVLETSDKQEADRKYSDQTDELTEVCVREDVNCEFAPEATEDGVDVNFVPESSEKPELGRKFSGQTAELTEVFVQEDLNCEYTLKLALHPLAPELSSRESSLDSEARNVFESVTRAEGSRSEKYEKPTLPARARISFEDVNCLLQSMDDGDEPIGISEKKVGVARDRRPILRRESTEESSDSELRKSRYDNISSASDKSLNWDQQTSDLSLVEIPPVRKSTSLDIQYTSIDISPIPTKPVPKPRMSKMQSSPATTTNKENVRANSPRKVSSVGRAGGAAIAKRIAMFESQPELGVVRARPAVVMTQSLREMDSDLERGLETAANELDSSPLYRRQREALLKEKRAAFAAEAASPRASLIELADFRLFEKSKSEPPSSGGARNRQRGFQEANLLLNSCDGTVQVQTNGAFKESTESEEYDNSEPLHNAAGRQRASIVHMHFV